MKKKFNDKDKLNVDYVVCPNCSKKLSCVTKKHLKSCGGDITMTPIYSEAHIGKLKQTHPPKTEEQKKHQSDILKARFKTPAGEITRKQIGEASIKMNADPEFKKKKIETFTEVNNRPEKKLASSITSKKRWADPEFRGKMKEYAEENIDELRASAANARKSLQKQSKLHKRYKENMVEKGITGFYSEYNFGPYAIDEADPLAKIALEIDGCYWHGCDICGFKGDTRIADIDKRKITYLENNGWVIIGITEHDILKDPYTGIEMIRDIQDKRKKENIEKIKDSFFNRELKVKSMVKGEEKPQWKLMSDILRHITPNKKIIKVTTPIGSVKVTEDHSLFNWNDKKPIQASKLKIGDFIIGAPWERFEAIEITAIEECKPEKYTYDVTVPESENAVLDSGILVHNSYSISGVSLDIEKASKYQTMADVFSQEYDKLAEAAKRSIIIFKGLRQQKYGVGVQSALGPLSRPGIQSRRNFVQGGGGGWS
jgi:very-short-patch-repair endonuclease